MRDGIEWSDEGCSRLVLRDGPRVVRGLRVRRGRHPGAGSDPCRSSIADGCPDDTDLPPALAHASPIAHGHDHADPDHDAHLGTGDPIR